MRKPQEKIQKRQPIVILTVLALMTSGVASVPSVVTQQTMIPTQIMILVLLNKVVKAMLMN